MFAKLMTNPDRQSALDDVSGGKGVIMIPIIAIICLLIAALLLSQCSAEDAAKQADTQPQQVQVQAQAGTAQCVSEKYGVDVSNAIWSYVCYFSDTQLYKGWGKDANGTPTLFYLESPKNAAPSQIADADDLVLYVGEPGSLSEVEKLNNDQ